MSTDERMDRRDFLRKTGVSATIGVSVASGAASAQETETGTETGTSTPTGTPGEGTPTEGTATDGTATEGTETTGTDAGTESEGTDSGTETGTSSGGGGASGPIDFGGFLDDANGWDGPGSTVNKTGQDEVTIAVGPKENEKAFIPAGVHVDPGTKIVWEWKSSGHNVHAKNADFSSEIKGSGTFEFTPEEDGQIINYVCEPHEGEGMIGSVAVGEVPRKEPVTPKPPAVDESTKLLGVTTFGTMVSTLGLAYFFLRYGGDYEQ